MPENPRQSTVVWLGCCDKPKESGPKSSDPHSEQHKSNPRDTWSRTQQYTGPNTFSSNLSWTTASVSPADQLDRKHYSKARTRTAKRESTWRAPCSARRKIRLNLVDCREWQEAWTWAGQRFAGASRAAARCRSWDMTRYHWRYSWQHHPTTLSPSFFEIITKTVAVPRYIRRIIIVKLKIEDINTKRLALCMKGFWITRSLYVYMWMWIQKFLWACGKQWMVEKLSCDGSWEKVARLGHIRSKQELFGLIDSNVCFTIRATEAVFLFIRCVSATRMTFSAGINTSYVLG